MLTHEALIKKMLKRKEVNAEYKAQMEEFALLDESLRARPPSEAEVVDTTGEES